MSAATETLLEQAIRDHLASESNGALMTGYVLQICGVDPVDVEVTRMLGVTPNEQPLVLTIGLAGYLTNDLAGFQRDGTL